MNLKKSKISKKSTKTTSTSGRKSTRSRSIETPPAAAAPVNAVPTTAATKLVNDLTAEEARKECEKLQIITPGERVKRETCILKLAEFLGVHGLSIGSFKFAFNGETNFPPPLLDSGNSGESGSDDDDDEEEEEEETRPETTRSKSQRRRKGSHVTFDLTAGEPSSGSSRPNIVSLPAGWHVMAHPESGAPVGMLDPSGKLLAITDMSAASAPPTWTAPVMGRTTSSGTSQNISAAAAMLGGNIPASHRGPQNTSSISLNSENVDFCNASIPGFVYSQESDTIKSKKRMSGKFTTGKKEVLKQEMWPHHLVDSLILPEGVEYDDCLGTK